MNKKDLPNMKRNTTTPSHDRPTSTRIVATTIQSQFSYSAVAQKEPRKSQAISRENRKSFTYKTLATALLEPHSLMLP